MLLFNVKFCPFAFSNVPKPPGFSIGYTPIERRNQFKKGYRPNAADLIDIRIWTLPEFQRICRLNANVNGNLVDEVTGCELTPATFGIDRVVNGIVRDVSRRV